MLAACSALCLQQPLNAVSAKPSLSSSTRISAASRHICASAPRQGSPSVELHSGDFLHHACGITENSFLADSIRRRVLLQTFLFNIAGTFLASESTKAIEETSVDCVTDLPITDKVYFDVAIDRQPVGRIVIGLYSADVPVGAKRFAEIAAGSRGVSYRKKEFDKITPSYVQNAGVRNFSLSGGIADAAKFTGGETVDALLPELETQNRKCPNSTKNVVNAVSIMVKDPSRPPPKQKLIAKDGKFEVIEEEFGPSLNGTQFIIVTKASQELDKSNLVVGKVVDGFDVLKVINGVRVVKDNTGSPYFKAAKLVGDTRAVVAERGFYRPYSKIVITGSGRLEV